MCKVFFGYVLGILSFAYYLEHSMSLVKHNDDYFLKDTNIHIVDTIEVVENQDTTYIYNLKVIK